MAWIELHQTLRDHKKMFACADALNLTRIEMIGTLVSLWLWALDNAQDGSLDGVSDKTIARVCDFPEKKAGRLMEALHNHGWLDKDADHYVIHDWYDYAGKLMERREKDRKRKKTSSNRRPDFQCSSSGNPAEVPGNSYATVPNRTVPYHTQPNMSGGGAAESARERAATESELASIGIKPGEYYGLTADFVETVRQTTDALFDKYELGTPKVWDYRQVSRYCGPADQADLLDYAFEQSGVAGKFGDWRYIDGIMDRLFTRGITTEKQARSWDRERPDWDNEEV